MSDTVNGYQKFKELVNEEFKKSDFNMEKYENVREHLTEDDHNIISKFWEDMDKFESADLDEVNKNADFISKRTQDFCEVIKTAEARKKAG